MATLPDFGFKKGWTYEAIISCFNIDTPHAAPFGIKLIDINRVQLEIYKGSNTLGGLLSTGEFIINFINSPIYFYESIYEGEKLSFTRAKNVKAPVIKDCTAYIEARVSGNEEKKESYIIDAEIISTTMKNAPVLFNRAEGLVIESLITATRVKYLPEGEAEKILKENYRVIKKVAPDSACVKTMEKLLSKCGTF
ncbi:MAG: DUF447 family protein [Desulfatiglans sp.]|nr:DUF447 family protein [Desulfatiglans sp.]